MFGRMDRRVLLHILWVSAVMPGVSSFFIRYWRIWKKKVRIRVEWSLKWAFVYTLHFYEWIVEVEEEIEEPLPTEATQESGL